MNLGFIKFNLIQYSAVHIRYHIHEISICAD
jgi:hypothetical protein